MAMVMKITMWSKMAFEQWKEEKDRKPSATSASQNLLSLKDLYSIRVPEPPEGNGLGGRISAEQVKSYIEALSAVFNMIDKEYSDRLLATLKSPTLEVLAICLQDMTAKSMQLDQLVGKTFMLKPLEKTMASIIAFKQHTDGEGRYSGLRIVQAMCAATTQLTGARLGELLKSVFKPLTDVPGEIQQLEPNYKKHSEALTALESLDIDLHPVIRCFLLQQMTSKLATKQEHQLILGIPMAGIVKDGFEDLGAMTAILESAITEANNDPKSSKPGVRPSRDRRIQQQIAAINAGAVPEDNRVCVNNRESSVNGYKCAKGADCRRKHVCSGKVCTKPEYAIYARCPDYYGTCEDTHPFHEAAKNKFGAPPIAWQALVDTLPKKGGKGGKGGKGKAYPMMPVLDSESDSERTITEDASSPGGDNIFEISSSDEEDNSGTKAAYLSSFDVADGFLQSEPYVETPETHWDGVVSTILGGEDEDEAPKGMATAPEPAHLDPNASAMSKLELEVFLGREISEGEMAAARLDASIKVIEDRESGKAQESGSATSNTPSSMTIGSADSFTATEGSDSDHSAEFSGTGSAEKHSEAKIQISKPAEDTEPAEVRCEEYEKSIMKTLEQEAKSSGNAVFSVAQGIPVIMFDSGAWRHIWGTDLVNSGMVYDVEDLKEPVDVDTAAGPITLEKLGTIQLRGIEFKGYLNPNMKISLISEGELFTNDGWEITGKDGGKIATPPTSLHDLPVFAEMVGKLAFWPHQDVVDACAEATEIATLAMQCSEVNLSDEPSEDSELDPESPEWRHREYYAPVKKASHFDQPAKQLGSRATKYGSADSSGAAVVQQLNSNKTLSPPADSTNPSSGGLDYANAFLQGEDTSPQPVIKAPGSYYAWEQPEPYGFDFSQPDQGAVITSVARNTRSNKKANNRPTVTDQDKSGITSETVPLGGTKDQEPDFDAELEPDAKPAAGLETGLLPTDVRSEWYIRHELDGHPYDPRCKTCVMGGLRAKRAINIPTLGEKIGLKYHQHLETAETDTLKFNDTDVDGNKGASGVILTKTSFGAVAMLKNFGAVAKAKAWRKLQSHIQSHTDPGGKHNYRLQRMKADQGTENQGAHKDALAEDKIMLNEGHRDRHPAQRRIENLFGRLQTAAATLGVGAFAESNEEYFIDTMGTRISHSATILQHRPCTEMQKEMGTSPIEEQFHPQCILDKPTHCYGELMFAHIEKQDRPNKTGPRAFMSIYAGECERIKGNIIVHPIAAKPDRSGYTIRPSVTVNRYSAVSGYYPLRYTPDHASIAEAPVHMDLLTYEEVMEIFAKPDEDDDDALVADEDEEVEKILDHIEDEDNEFEYLLKWKDADECHNSWHHEADLTGCEQLIANYWEENAELVAEVNPLAAFISETCGHTTVQQSQYMQNFIGMVSNPTDTHSELGGGECMMVVSLTSTASTDTKPLTNWQVETLLGNRMCYSEKCAYPTIEIPPKEFITMEGGKEAVKIELDQMYARRFNTDKPVPEHLKKTALECRLICTQKRDGRMKARLVAKDLKSRRKLPATSTYAAVPAMYGFKILVAAADGRTDIISTTDYHVAYLQSENRTDETTWLLVWYRDPITNERIYVWLMGEIYGGQPAGKVWKDHLCHKMVMVGGFMEVKNMENMYYHPFKHVAISVHVDDPFIVAKSEESHLWTHEFMDANFDTKGINRLRVGVEIDYCSMEVNLLENGDITLTNYAKCMKMLEDAGMSDVLPTTMPPMTKSSLKAALTLDEPLSESENSARLGDNGRFGWLAQTTHLGLVVATSIAQGLPAVQGTKKVSAQMYAWVKAHAGDGLISRAADKSGLASTSDSDWAGMHSVTGETRSRNGDCHRYNGMVIDAHSSLQKTVSSEFTEVEAMIATSSGNAELIAASGATTRGLHLSYIIEELGQPIERPIRVGLDANAALGFLDNTGSSGRMKHLDIREDWIQQARDRTIVEFHKEPTEEIDSDFFTKLHDKTEYDRKYARLAYIPGCASPSRSDTGK